MPALAIGLVGADGDERAFDVLATVPARDAVRERLVGLRLVAPAGTPDAGARYADYWRRVVARASTRAVPPDTRAVRFYAVQISTVPEDRDQPPRAPTLLYELPFARP